MSETALQGYLILSALIFTLGGVGIMVRRSPLVMLMCVELMWSGAALALITFARHVGNMDGHIFAFFVMIVAAAEVAIGLALIVVLFRRREEADADDIQLLRG